MKADPRIEDILNTLLKQHCQAKDMYRIERHIFRNRGYGSFAGKINKRKDVHDEAVQSILSRLLFLEFTPDLNYYEPPRMITEVQVFLQNGQIFETTLTRQIADAVNDTRGLRDEVTHRLLGTIGKQVEDNVWWFEKELKRYGDIGQQLYMSKMF